MLMGATPSERPPANTELVAPPAFARLGLAVFSVHVAVPTFGPLLTYACTLRSFSESCADVSVKSHHTPAFGAKTRCDCAEWPLAPTHLSPRPLPIFTGGGSGHRSR